MSYRGATLSLAKIYEVKGDYEKSIQAYKKVILQYATGWDWINIKDFENLVRICVNNLNSTDKALNECREILRVVSTESQKIAAQFMIAKIYDKYLANQKKAIEEYKKVIEINPTLLEIKFKGDAPPPIC